MPPLYLANPPICPTASACRCAREPMVLPFPESAINVDKPADLELVTRILEQREGLSG